jgi:hypothetical protein
LYIFFLWMLEAWFRLPMYAARPPTMAGSTRPPARTASVANTVSRMFCGMMSP